MDQSLVLSCPVVATFYALKSRNPVSQQKVVFRRNVPTGFSAFEIKTKFVGDAVFFIQPQGLFSCLGKVHFSVNSSVAFPLTDGLSESSYEVTTDSSTAWDEVPDQQMTLHQDAVARWADRSR